MSKLEKVDFESQISPEQELTRKEREVIRKAQRIFEKNAVLSKELLNEDDLSLSSERIQELNDQVGEIGTETKEALNELEKARADSYGIKKAA